MCQRKTKKLLLSYSDKFLLDPRKSKKKIDEQSMLKWSSTTVLLLLLLHKNTDYYRPDNLWIMWLARKKKQICWWQRNLWENFIKVRSPVLPDFWISETTKFFRKRSNWSGFGRLLEIFPPPPTCQCAAPRPTWSGPAHLPPASLSPKKQNKKSVLFYKREKKVCCCSLPFSHWFHPRLMAIVVT